MSTKFLLLFILMMNFVTIMINAACLSSDSDMSCSGFEQGGGNIISKFLSWDPAASMFGRGSVEATSEFEKVASDLNTPTSGVSSLVGGTVSFFLDALKMMIGLIVILTPLPSLILLDILNFPLGVSLFLGIILVIMYIIGIGEFLGGRKL